MKWGPPSLMMNVGSGKKATHRSHRILAAVAAVWSRVGTNTQMRVSWSSITKMCLKPPFLFVRIDMKSRAITSIGLVASSWWPIGRGILCPPAS